MSDVDKRISEAIAGNGIVIFMKGNRHFPQCGFSAAAVEVFENLQVPFATVDVLADPELREGIKQHTKWPTIPQVFIDGKFVGGCDIVREMYETGELEPLARSAVTKNK